jgi:glycosyltransferase involved in cell wall biosynthesis
MTAKQANSKPVITIFLPDLSGGGAERSMVILANALAARGYTVDLVLAIRRGVYFDELSEEVNLIDLGTTRAAGSLFAFIRYLKKRQPCVVIAVLNRVALISIWAKVISRLNFRLCVSVRAVLSEAYRRQSRVRSWIVTYLVTIFYHFADMVIAVSDDVRKDLINHFGLLPNKVVTIYNAFDLEYIQNQAQYEVNHPWLNHKECAIVLGAGRLHPEKDFGTLLRAFALVLQKTDCRLVILGEGEEREKLQKLAHQLNISDKVDLPGFDPNPFKYMKRADVFVLSSRFDALPGVLLQAMALGTPVVATDCPGGVREILEDGKWGAIVPLDDLPALAEAILKGLRGELPDPTPRAADFAVEKIVDQYLKLMGLG